MIWCAYALGIILLVFSFLYGFKKTGLGIYFCLKATIFKIVEYVVRSLIAVLSISVYFWASFCIIALFIEVFVASPTCKFVWLSFLVIYGIMLFYKFVYNFRDEDDRDLVRMNLAQLEHQLCFKNRELSIYPNDWHWMD